MVPSPRVSTELSSILSTPRPLVWLFAGDSITQGAVHTNGWRDYTQLFKERLYEIGRKEDVVINTAISGSNIRRINSRFDERIGRFHPDVLFLMLGTNDTVSGAENVKPFSAQYTEVIQKARRAGISLIVVQTTVPVVPPDFKRVAGRHPSTQNVDMQRLESRANFLPAYVEATRSVASKEKVPLIDHWSAWPVPIPEQLTLMNDAIHPNEYGHRRMAETLFRQFGIWDEYSRVCRSISKEGIQLSNYPQLFLDDELISRMENLKREMVAPVKHPANPLIVQDQPWEKRMFQIYGTVLFEPRMGKFRCWYLGCEDEGKTIDRPEGPVTVEYYQCYAESADGVRWTKPMVGTEKFGSYEKHNIVVFGGHGFCVLPDPDDPDPNKRYKGLGGNMIGFSPDGIRWSLQSWKAVGKNDTSSCVVKWKGEYLAYVRNQGKWENGIMREVGLSVSKDFVTWTPKKTVFKTDEKDGYPWTQPYGIAVTPYGDQLIGIVWLIRLDRKPGNNKHGIIDETQLIVSRDGRTWTRVADRANFLTPTPATWDAGGVWPGTTMFVKDDRVYIYYTGTQNRHGEKFARPAIGLATLPADRFVGLHPEDPARAGLLETVPLRLDRKDLIVNGDGDIRVEILDEKGTRLPGFEKEKCRFQPYGPNRRRITWDKPVESRPVVLRFIITKGVLFAFSVAEAKPL